MTTKKIGVLVGSLRKGSYSRKIARVLMELSPEDFIMEEVDLHQLAMYNQDFDDENNPPESWQDFRATMKKFDAVLFVTPEYNRSVPGVLKNAIDVGSRPYGESVWDGKPGAVVSVSPGRISAFGANHHLRQSMVFLNVPMMQQPEAYIGDAAGLFDDQGKFINAPVRQSLQDFMAAYAVWVERNEVQPPKKYRL